MSIVGAFCMLSPSRAVKTMQKKTKHKTLLSSSDMQQHECAMSWKAHDGEVYSVEFSYDENTVYSIGEDGKVGTRKTLGLCIETQLHGGPVGPQLLLEVG